MEPDQWIPTKQGRAGDAPGRGSCQGKPAAGFSACLPPPGRLSLTQASMRKQSGARSGFTLVEVIIVVAILGLLAAIGIPNYVKVRAHAQANTCINNLRIIDASKQQWALEMRRSGDSAPDEADLMPYLVRGNSGRVPVCPSGGSEATFELSYEINVVTNPPACLILPDTHKLPP
jgi:prepilin-type N-terminal cleavage/methylation domain-containing protein